MAISNPDPADVLRRIFQVQMKDVHTSMPAKVVSYDSAAQVVDVQPMVKDVVKDDEGEEEEYSYPVLKTVPVVFPRGGGFFVSFPIAAGDFVLIVFSEWSMDRFMELGREVHPVDLERHGLSGAVAIPGIYPNAQALSEADASKMVAGKDGGAQIAIDTGGGVEIGSKNGAKQYVALSDKTNQRISDLETSLNSLITAYNTHIHITTATVGPTPVPGVISPTVSQATPATPGAPVGSTKVKAEE